MGLAAKTRSGSLLLAAALAAGAPALSAAGAAAQDHSGGSGRGASGEAGEQGRLYTVQAGDVLSEVAARLGVTVEDLVRWNEGLEPDRIRVGQRLRVLDGLRRVVHTVERGEALSRVAARYEVGVQDVLEWNRLSDPDRIAAGRRLVIFTPRPRSRSESVGTPQQGRLLHGRRLRSRPGFVVRSAERAWGTDEAVRWIVEAFEALRRDDPEAPRIEVHDLSLREGGPIRGHHSHESGRDVDLAYFQARCPGDRCRFARIGPDQLDVARQWRLIARWLENDQVEAIFMDHDLQRALYEHARSLGFSRRQLGRWFQYPRPPEERIGVIRHHPRHADHLHVRFVCHESDAECR